jgi:hypothetical protein
LSGSALLFGVFFFIGRRKANAKQIPEAIIPEPSRTESLPENQQVKIIPFENGLDLGAYSIVRSDLVKLRTKGKYSGLAKFKQQAGLLRAIKVHTRSLLCIANLSFLWV